MVKRLPKEWGKAVYLAGWVEYNLTSTSLKYIRDSNELLTRLERLLSQLMKTKVIIETIPTKLGTDWRIIVPKLKVSSTFISLDNAVLGLYAYKKEKSFHKFADYLLPYVKLRQKYHNKWSKWINLT